MLVWNRGPTKSNPTQIDEEHPQYCLQKFFQKDFNTKFSFEKKEEAGESYGFNKSTLAVYLKDDLTFSCFELMRSTELSLTTAC